MRKYTAFTAKLKIFIAKNRDEIIGAICLLVFVNTLLLGFIYNRQAEGLDNQDIMLGNDKITIKQNKIILDSIAVKWKISYKNLKTNGAKQTGSD